MPKEKIDKLREKLYLLITEKASYCEILKVSKELDLYIAEVTSECIREREIKNVNTESNTKVHS